MQKDFIENEFKKYVEKYIPFPWDTNAKDPRPFIQNKHSLLMGYIRFLKIVQSLSAIKNEINRVVDIGPYPGMMVHLLRDFINKNIDYTGIGLGFSDEYQKAMKELNAKIFQTDIDPSYIDAEECKEWPVDKVDLCLLLDVIEHLTEPVFCLDQVNRVLKPGGLVLLTTDNITNFGYIYNMIRRGDSPNVHPLRSSLFYRGPWRPHVREYASNELKFYLEYCGFEILWHKYFERKQGDFYFGNNNALIEKPRYTGLKSYIKKSIIHYFPHLQDHQILLAKKISDFNEISQRRPKATKSMDEWMMMRSEAGID